MGGDEKQASEAPNVILNAITLSDSEDELDVVKKVTPFDSSSIPIAMTAPLHTGIPTCPTSVPPRTFGTMYKYYSVEPFAGATISPVTELGSVSSRSVARKRFMAVENPSRSACNNIDGGPKSNTALPNKAPKEIIVIDDNDDEDFIHPTFASKKEDVPLTSPPSLSKCRAPPPSDSHINKSGSPISALKKRKYGSSSSEPSPKSSSHLLGMRPVGDVDDSGKGATCHQCRQKRTTMAVCKNVASKRLCTQKFCSKCLLNRYGESVSEVGDCGTWNCPRCRGICNCSICMKKKGLPPTGGMTFMAKAAGYLSVADLLLKLPDTGVEVLQDQSMPCEPEPETVESIVQVGGNCPTIQSPKPKRKGKTKTSLEVIDNCDSTATAVERDVGGIGQGKTSTKVKHKKKPKKVELVETFQSDACKGEHDKENTSQVLSGNEKNSTLRLDGNVDLKKKIRKPRFLNGLQERIRKALSSPFADGPEEEPQVAEEIVIPVGAQMVHVAEIEFPAEAIGPALQVLEFCSAFQQPLKLRKNQGEKILEEMVRGGSLRRGGQSQLVQFHVRLLSMILDEIDEDYQIAFSPTSKNCWVEVLRRHFFSPETSEATLPAREGDSSNSASLCGSNLVSFVWWPCLSEDRTVIERALESGVDGYAGLAVSTRIQLLASLCDDTLSTSTMRDHVEKVITDHDNIQRGNREELQAIKKRVKEASEAKRDAQISECVGARNNIFPVLSRAQTKLIADAKQDSKQLSASEAALSEEAARLSAPRCDAMRTEPEAVHKQGGRFWRLKGADDRHVFLFQDISNLELEAPKETWSFYSKDQEEVVSQCISSIGLQEKDLRKSQIKRSTHKKLTPVCKGESTPAVASDPSPDAIAKVVLNGSE